MHLEPNDRQLSLDNDTRPFTEMNDHSRTLPSLAPKPHNVSADNAAATTVAAAVSTATRTQYSQPHIFMDNNAAHGRSHDASQLKVVSARGTPKGPLPIEVQLKLLSSVLRHDPFNCPIRRTTQVWECIAREQGIRARTCARRYDNILQASIAGRDRSIGTEEQVATKRKLLEQLFEMMNQPQALVRMQKKRRYRSEEADRQLLLETIRLNPFGQKVGHVAKAWEDVRDALHMKVHARQCIRRVNRMIKPYLLRERMYKGNIPKEMREVNDELVKQVIQLMQQAGHAESLEDEAGNSNEDESASDSDDQGEGEGRYQEEDELEDDRDETMVSPDRSPSTRANNAQAPSTRPATPGISEPPSGSSTAHTTPAQRGRLRNSSQGSWEKKSEPMDPSLDESKSVRVEFRPQRIWGSHPYSKDALSRSASGSQRSRSGHTLYSKSGSHHRPVKHISTNNKAQGDGSNVGIHRYPAESEQETSAVRSPLSETSSRPALPSPTASSVSTSMSRHGPVGEHHRHSSGSAAPTEPTSPLYRVILDEFHTVKTYLGHLEGQRQRDKHNQQTMYQMMERMQQQLQQQEQAIQDIKSQLQFGFQRTYQNSPPHQHRRRQSSLPYHDRHNGDGQVQSGDDNGGHNYRSSGEYHHRSSEGIVAKVCLV
ncbi:hypothetical protein BGZ51_002625 [Haplosporangium sp. Z 767]|nr:hypothetical protein BGZ51_002625 [Haplosporangium sp. Z 767]KAF9197063.1 hypothetical protein BGZ50_000013 [Haplosporangium sp. Z 11]